MIKRELSIFLLVGSLTVLVDFAVYRSLVWSGAVGIDTAKGAGFISGTLFAYLANRFWTFGHRSHAAGSILRFALLYATTLGINVALNFTALKVMQDSTMAVLLAFLVATMVSAALNFVGMKYFVFKTHITVVQE